MNSCHSDVGLAIAVAVLGSIIVILCIIIALLVYKLRNTKYKVVETSTEEHIEKGTHEIRRQYTPQVSQGSEPTIEFNFGTLTRKSAETQTLSIPEEKESTPPAQRFLATIKNPSFTTELKTHLLKTRKQTIIERDEIHKICANELTKSQTYITGHEENTPVQNLRHRLSVPDVDKSASMPDLLETDDYYDELPHTNSRPVTNPPEVDEVYDMLPHTNKIIVKDEDSGYLVFISDERSVEPCYTNAKIAM